MLDILVVCRTAGKAEIRRQSYVPRIGEKVCVYYQPWPTVREVLWWPTTAMCKEVCNGRTPSECELNADVILIVD